MMTVSQFARALGWYSVALGTTELLAGRRLAQVLGMPNRTRRIRLFGTRELVHAALVFTQPAIGVSSRVIGDVMDLASLAAALKFEHPARTRVGVALGLVTATTVTDTLCALQLVGAGRPIGGVSPTAVRRNAPTLLQLAPGALIVVAGAALYAMRGSTAPLPQNVAQRRARAATSGIQVERAITITRPIAEVYAFWRDFENLARFMSHLESVRVKGDRRSHWVAKGPAGSRVEWDALLTEEEPERRLAWRSVEGSQIMNEGRVDFRTAPADRGTEVRVRLTYQPPVGALGAAFARLFGEEPSQQVDEDLRRLKRLLETGSEPTNGGQPSGRKSPVTRGLARLYDNRRTA